MSLVVNDPDFRLYCGDVADELQQLPDNSVHCVVTSPPYYGLRDYGVDGQLGLETTLDEYVERLVSAFGEIRRVLHPSGVVWLNLGDSFSSGNRRTYDRQTSTGNGAVADAPRPSQQEGLKPKDLLGVPWRVALALQSDGWWLRQCVVWAKPNPVPESVRDRPSTAHEFVFLLAPVERYYYDAEAVKEPHSFNRYGGKAIRETADEHKRPPTEASARALGSRPRDCFPGSGRNLRSVWEIPTEPYPDAHFATFPSELVRRCVRAGTSERGVCPDCLAPWRRIVEVEYENPGNRTTNGPRSTERRWGDYGTVGFDVRLERVARTVGWESTCDCVVADGPELCPPVPIPATVLDPFLGSGTTALVARQLGRRAVGVELSADYCAQAARRLSQLSLFGEVAGVAAVDGSPRDPLDDRPAPAHRNGRGTERAAAEFVRPRAGTGRARVLAAIRASGDRGLSDYEIARKTGLRLYTAAPRRCELLKDGWLIDSGLRRPTDSGTDAIVWTLSDRAKAAA